MARLKKFKCVFALNLPLFKTGRMVQPLLQYSTSIQDPPIPW